jgi:hypothetical protein
MVEQTHGGDQEKSSEVAHVSEVIGWVQPNEVLISCKRPERVYVP